MNKNSKLAIAVALVYAVDQLTKWAVITSFTYGQSRRIFPFLYLTYVRNTGTAFGFFQGANWIFILVSVVIISVLIRWRHSLQGCGITGSIGLALILGGALGNLTDRIFRGSVVDFLDFIVWPVFNAADSAICIGTALLMIVCIWGKSAHASNSF